MYLSLFSIIFLPSIKLMLLFFTKYSDYQGGKILTGGSVLESEGNFVQPTIVEISSDAPVVKEELFGPVLYVMKFKVVYNLYIPLLNLILKEFSF